MANGERPEDIRRALQQEHPPRGTADEIERTVREAGPYRRGCVFRGDSKGEGGGNGGCGNTKVRFPLWPSGESEDHTGGPRRLFGSFLAGEKGSSPPPWQLNSLYNVCN